jgi:hypothetical protein
VAYWLESQILFSSFMFIVLLCLREFPVTYQHNLQWQPQ